VISISFFSVSVQVAIGAFGDAVSSATFADLAEFRGLAYVTQSRIDTLLGQAMLDGTAMVLCVVTGLLTMKLVLATTRRQNEKAREMWGDLDHDKA